MSSKKMTGEGVCFLVKNIFAASTHISGSLLNHGYIHQQFTK